MTTGGLPGRVFIGPQQPAVERLRAEQVEQAGRGRRPRRAAPPRGPAACRRGPARSTSRRTIGSRPDVDVLPGRRPVLRDVDAGRPQPQHREPSGVGYGSGFSSSALTTLKIAVLAPMPMASEATMTSVRPAASSQRPDGVADVLHKGCHCSPRHIMPPIGHEEKPMPTMSGRSPSSFRLTSIPLALRGETLGSEWRGFTPWSGHIIRGRNVYMKEAHPCKCQRTRTITFRSRMKR